MGICCDHIIDSFGDSMTTLFVCLFNRGTLLPEVSLSVHIEEIISLKQIVKTEGAPASVLVGSKMTAEMLSVMSFHISENIVLKLFEQIVKVEIKVVGLGTMPVIEIMIMSTLLTSVVISLSFIGI